MKPVIHLIPLRPDERDFISAVLSAAPAGSKTAGAAAVIAHTPPADDGLIDVVLDDADCSAVCVALSYHSLDRIGVKGVGGHLVQPTSGMIFRDVETSSSCNTLCGMFCDFRLNLKRITGILHAAPESSLFLGRSHHAQRFYGLRADVWGKVSRGWYTDDANSIDMAATQFDTVVAAFRRLEAEGAGRLCREPAGRGRKYDRVCIDWHFTMYDAHPARRIREQRPSALGPDEESALSTLAT